MSDDKVVPFRTPPKGESIPDTMRRLAGAMEAETDHKPSSGFIVVLSNDGRMVIYNLGDTADELQCIGLMRIAETVLVDEILGA